MTGTQSALAPSSLPAPKRILALHGKGENRVNFRNRIQPLLDRLDDTVTVSFLEAPFELGSGGTWWKLPPGVRSFEAEAYEGVSESLALIAGEFTAGPVYGVIGFSQGAILLAFFMASQCLLRLGGQPALLPSKALLVGGAWPKPYTEVMDKLQSLSVDGLSLLGCETLHVVGEADLVNPTDQGLAVAACFGDAATVHVHPGKHIVPVDAESLSVMADFLLKDWRAECAL